YSVVNNRRQMTMKYPNDRLIEKNFDILDRLSNIKQGDNAIADYSYIGRSYRLLSKQFGNNDAVNYLYDQGRRMTSKEARNKNSDLINHYKYSYNKVHMKNYEQRMHENGIGDVFGYDAVYRLTNAKFNVPDQTVENPTGFEREKSIVLDHVDNITRIEEIKNGETSQVTTEIPLDTDYSKLNQYSRFDQWGLAYDKNGNLTQKGTQKMYFDFRNQAVRVTEGTTTTENKYDALGRRLQKVVTSGSQAYTENFYHSGHQVIEVRDGNDQVKRQFIYGNGIDEVIRMDAYYGSTITPYYFHTNAIGSTTAVADANGQVVERYKYSLFGMPTFMDAAGNEIPNSTIGNNILFQGREYEPETNFYYFRARHLDPIMGRFLQVDPMGYQDSMNLYQAFNMNPVNFVDPFGKDGYRMARANQYLADVLLYGEEEAARRLNKRDEELRRYAKAGIYFSDIGDYVSWCESTKELWNEFSLGNLWDFTIDTFAVMLPVVVSPTKFKKGLTVADELGELNKINDLAKAEKEIDKALDAFKTQDKVEDVLDTSRKGAFDFPEDPNVFTKQMGVEPTKVSVTQHGTTRMVWEPNSNTRIRFESHPEGLKVGDPGYNPRHHGSHYHIEIKPNNMTWNKAKKKNLIKKIKPEDYVPGMGTGLLPNEKLPGKVIEK
ncbi:RHS repeat domain-containing protein, partial [Acidobacteriota bacterium]